jgi:hypothetical protein
MDAGFLIGSRESQAMCAHAEEMEICPLCEVPTFFTQVQIAFLEDLLINGCCMTALKREKRSLEPEKCRSCAENIFDAVERIREMKV